MRSNEITMKSGNLRPNLPIVVGNYRVIAACLALVLFCSGFLPHSTAGSDQSSELARVCLALEAGNLVAAETNLRGLARLHEDWPEYRVQLASVLVAQGREAEGRELLKQAERIFEAKQRTEEIRGLEGILGQTQGVANALSRFDAKLGYRCMNAANWLCAELMSRLVILLEPDWPYGHKLLGSALQSAGRLDAAESAYRTSIKLALSDPDAFARLGSLQLAQGKLEEAEASARHAIELDPNHAAGWQCLCLALEKRGRYGEMTEPCQKAMALAPDYPPVSVALASAMNYLGRLPEAEKYARHALRLDPKNVDALNTLGQLLSASGQFDEAEKHLRQAIRLKPEFAIAHIGLGAVLERKNQVGEAEKHYREAVRLSPSDPRVRTCLGAHLLSAGRLEEAERELREATRIQPELAEAHFQLGSLYQRQGKKRLAEEHYRQVIRLVPSHAPAYNNLGYLLIDEPSRWTEAETLIRKALELASQAPPAAKAYFWGSLAELLSKQPTRKAEALQTYREAFAAFSASGNSKEAERVEREMKRLEADAN
jgi:Flp pilus assembly protein TadD